MYRLQFSSYPITSDGNEFISTGPINTTVFKQYIVAGALPDVSTSRPQLAVSTSRTEILLSNFVLCTTRGPVAVSGDRRASLSCLILWKRFPKALRGTKGIYQASCAASRRTLRLRLWTNRYPRHFSFEMDTETAFPGRILSPCYFGPQARSAHFEFWLHSPQLYHIVTRSRVLCST
jgi:hypothetical protein